MEVILQSDFPSLGYVGDRVKVARGYARNFLIPRGVAVEASSKNEAQINHLLSSINKKRARLRAEAEDLVKKLEAVTLEFKLKVGEGGKVFGSITTKDLETALKAQGFEIARKQFKLTEPLKKAGESTVSIKLHSEVTGSIKVKMLLEGQHPQSEADGEKKKGARGKKAGGRKAKGGSVDNDGAEEGATEEAAEQETAKETEA